MKVKNKRLDISLIIRKSGNKILEVTFGLRSETEKWIIRFIIRRVNCDDAIFLRMGECETPDFDIIANLEWLEA